MSRIGKAPIDLPQGVEVNLDEKKAVVTVKGPKGELTRAIHPGFNFEIKDGTLELFRPSEQQRHKALHGLYRSLINNMVVGVSEGFVKELELHGVGYRASNKGNLLELALGYSHPIMFYIPDEVQLETIAEKGKPPTIVLKSIDKELIGQISAKIRSFRKPEPYKGKGIRFKGEEIRRKAGKVAGA